MTKKTLTERIEKLETNSLFLMNDYHMSCLHCLQYLFHSICEKYAIDQLIDEFNWIPVSEMEKISNKKFPKTSPTIIRNGKLCTLTSLGEKNYKRHYHDKLEDLTFNKLDKVLSNIDEERKDPMDYIKQLENRIEVLEKNQKLTWIEKFMKNVRKDLK